MFVSDTNIFYILSDININKYLLLLAIAHNVPSVFGGGREGEQQSITLDCLIWALKREGQRDRLKREKGRRTGQRGKKWRLNGHGKGT